MFSSKPFTFCVHVYFRHQTGAMQCKLSGPGSSCSWLWVSWSTGLLQQKLPRLAPQLKPLHCPSAVQACSSARQASYICGTAVFRIAVCTAVHRALFIGCVFHAQQCASDSSGTACTVHLSADFAVRMLCAHRVASVPSHCWME